MQDNLTQKVLTYLRENNVLKGKPLFRNTATRFMPVDPRGEWDEYYMVYPYWQNVEINSHKEDFDSIDSQLTKITFDEVQEEALSIIPENSVIIELGSGYGWKGAGYLAKHKPNTKVILISKKWEEDISPKYLFIPYTKLKHTLTFTEGKETLDEPNFGKKINALYKANNIHNLSFYEHELTLGETSKDSLPHFLRGLNGKEIYLFGHQSPKRLPFLIANLYNALNAKYMCVSLTALEKIKPDQFPWKIVQKNLGLTDEELKGYIESAHDHEATRKLNGLPDKYDYKQPAQERIGVMIKLGIALALAKEVNGEVLRDNNPEFRCGYNKIDHYVKVRR